jgi:hypothetical protein
MSYGDSKIIDWRGGWPYFVPYNCQRYGLKVEGKYGANDNWLLMNGNK